MPAYQKRANFVSTKGYGKSLLKNIKQKSIHHLLPDNSRIQTIKERKGEEDTDLINPVPNENSCLELNDITDFLSTYENMNSRSTQVSGLLIEKSRDTYFDTNKQVDVNEIESNLKDSMRIGEIDIAILERPLNFDQPHERILNFVYYLGEFLKLNRDKKFVESEITKSYENDSVNDISDYSDEEYTNKNNLDERIANDKIKNDDAPVIKRLENPYAKFNFILPHKYEKNIHEALEFIVKVKNNTLLNAAIFYYFTSHKSNYSPFLNKKQIVRIELNEFTEWRTRIARKDDQANENNLSGLKKFYITPFEKNLNIWKQLWYTVDYSDVLIQILDARNPLLFFSKPLDILIRNKGKKSVILINKADYLSNFQIAEWSKFFSQFENLEVFFYCSLKEIEFTPEKNENEDDKVNHILNSKYKTLSIAARKSWRSIISKKNLLNNLKSIEKSNQNQKSLLLKQAEQAYDIIVKKFSISYSNCHEINKLLRQIRAEIDLSIGINNSSSFEFRSVEEFVKFIIGDKCTLTRMIEDFEKKNAIKIGVVGYPNVGKSSFINSLIDNKIRLKTSSTPGKTKHIQTVFIKEHNIIFCDCPGLIFPNTVITENDLVINGIINVNTYKGSMIKVCKSVFHRVLNQILFLYNLKQLESEEKLVTSQITFEKCESILTDLAEKRNFYKAGKGKVPNIEFVSRMIIKEYIKGRLFSYSEMPPNADSDIWLNEEKAKWINKVNFLTQRIK